MRAFAITIVVLATVSGCMNTQTADQAAMTLAPTAADRETPAYKACVAAIAKTTGVSDMQVFDYVYSEAGTQIQATIPSATAPWRCLASNDGVVEQVMFTGSEGAL